MVRRTLVVCHLLSHLEPPAVAPIIGNPSSSKEMAAIFVATSAASPVDRSSGRRPTDAWIGLKARQSVLWPIRTKLALRDVGKALGFPIEKVEQLAKTAYGTPEQWIGDACLQEYGFDPQGKGVQLWLEMAGAVKGFPRHPSQYTGGFVISRDKLSRLVPWRTRRWKPHGGAVGQ